MFLLDIFSDKNLLPVTTISLFSKTAESNPVVKNSSKLQHATNYMYYDFLTR